MPRVISRIVPISRIVVPVVISVASVIAVITAIMVQVPIAIVPAIIAVIPVVIVSVAILTISLGVVVFLVGICRACAGYQARNFVLLRKQQVGSRSLRPIAVFLRPSSLAIAAAGAATMPTPSAKVSDAAANRFMRFISQSFGLLAHAKTGARLLSALTNTGNDCDNGRADWMGKRLNEAGFRSLAQSGVQGELRTF